MSVETFKTLELLIYGWMFGIMTSLLYASISSYIEVKRRDRREKILLDAGVDPFAILKMRALPLIAAVLGAALLAPPAHAAPVSSLLSQVTIVDHISPVSGYQRGCKDGQGCVFGPAWNSPGQACDTRNRVLAAQLHDVQFKAGTHDCKVASGWEDDPYTGQRVDVHDVQIDHIVPLKAAWNAGASHWTPQERQRFANDPGELLAVSAHANQAKGDSTLSAWLPANTAERCPYVEQYLTVSVTYQLPISRADAAAATNACRE